jgi:hypothetical protein
MNINMEKTIPFRLSPAELANFRLLRKGMVTFDTIQDDEAGAVLEEINPASADPAPADQEVEAESVDLMDQEQA